MKLYAAKVAPPSYREEDVIEITERIFLVDGYSFGDRLLEGVMFEVEFDNNGDITSVKVEDESADYFEQLNTEYWLGAAERYAEGILEEGDEVEIPKRLEEKYLVNGRNVCHIS